jgi:predicted nuclease with TOPRIM domain
VYQSGTTKNLELSHPDCNYTLQCKFEDYKTEMSNDASRTESLRGENRRLKCENTDLTERMNNFGLILADLHTKLKIAEDEKASLSTAIRLMQSRWRSRVKTM